MKEVRYLVEFVEEVDSYEDNDEVVRQIKDELTTRFNAYLKTMGLNHKNLTVSMEVNE